MTRALMVLTSHDKLGTTGRATGFYASEAAEPWAVFRDAGFDIDVASVAGGRAPIDGRDDNNLTQAAFFAAVDVDDTRPIKEIDPDDYDVIFFAGGHGTMWDFPDNRDIARLATGIYEHGGVVAAVCHGPAALVNVRLSDGSYLVAGKMVAAFTNEEETIVGLSAEVPFLLADALSKHGAQHIPAAPWATQVVTDGRLVTGQNPQSATRVAASVVAILTGRVADAS